MAKQKTMQDKEKFRHAFGMVRSYQKNVLPFVEERLGYPAMHELSSVWQAAIIPIHEEAPDGEKYESAYSNWLWMARCSHDFLADLLKGEDIIAYKRMILRFYKHQQDNTDLAFYRMLGNQRALAKAWLYEIQWISPLEMSSNGDKVLTCTVKGCKVLQTPATQRICRVDCQNVGTNLARNLYHLKRETSITGTDCTITLSPLEEQD